MKFNFKAFQKAFDHFRYDSTISEDAELEIILRQEDVGQGKLGDSVTLVIMSTNPPGSYSKYKGKVTVINSLEIFPNSENRPARLTKQETQEMTEEL